MSDTKRQASICAVITNRRICHIMMAACDNAVDIRRQPQRKTCQHAWRPSSILVPSELRPRWRCHSFIQHGAARRVAGMCALS